MILVSFLWFIALLVVALTILRVAQGYVKKDTSIGQALAFILH